MSGHRWTGTKLSRGSNEGLCNGEQIPRKATCVIMYTLPVAPIVYWSKWSPVVYGTNTCHYHTNCADDAFNPSEQ